MIYQTINFNSFKDAFNKAGRGDQFSLYGLKMLYNYLEDLSNDMGQDLELDVIELCCNYSEYTLSDFIAEYDIKGVDSYEDLNSAIDCGDIDFILSCDMDLDVILVNNNF